ncbi:spore cortex-lytic enzyme [Bacillus massilinigeriensis]|uniref:spore cortex-lytic enzyme n=1 Tax=Bacillus mediterraneensis TaxID=1805474 RepID=UPI001F2874F3|nr:spore cortex-lytic enzyme [Bacillus mediterraneensis]
MLAVVPIAMIEQPTEAFSNQVIQRGAVGEDVIELQSRLQYLGYYKGKVDGVFGWGTYWALRNFQEKFGLPVDGLAGAKTKQKLVKASKYNRSTATKKTKSPQTKVTAANVPNGYSKNDIQLMANAVHGEARGEPYIGQVAVAAVIINRVENASFPNSISGVIFEPGAFTAVADGQIWLTPNETSKKAVVDALNGWDPTGDALYYFNPATATSKWIWSRPQIKRIGKHIFCE